VKKLIASLLVILSGLIFAVGTASAKAPDMIIRP